MTDLKVRIAAFLEDYNSLLEELNDELSGIEDMELNKEAKTLKDVEIGNLECDEVMYEKYHLLVYELVVNNKGL